MFVQLWDIDEGGRGHMPAGKFSAIIRKVEPDGRQHPVPDVFAFRVVEHLEHVQACAIA